MRLILSLFVLLFAQYCQSQQTAAQTMALYQVTEQNGLSDDNITCVLKDHHGFVWIGTADGLNLMDGSQVTIFKHAENDRNSISSNDVKCITEDNAGVIWVGTSMGINGYDPVQHHFTTYIPVQHDYGASNFIRSLVAANQQIWCATDGGLFLFDLTQKTFQPVFNTAEIVSHSINELHYLMQDHTGILWLCTSDGLWSFNPQNKQYKKEIAVANDPQYDPLCLYVLEDHNGSIWAGSWSKGIKQLDRQTGKVTSYRMAEKPQTVDCIKEIRQVNGQYVFWINGPLLNFNPSSKVFFQYPVPFEAPVSPDVHPYCLSADNWIWLGSGKGLFIYNPQRQLFHHHFPGPDVSQSVSFTEWRKGLLVGAQVKDFLKLYNDDWTLRKDYSLIPHSFAAGSSQRTASLLSFQNENDSSIWIGTSDGLMQVDPCTGKNTWWLHKAGDSTSLPRNFITHVFIDSYKKLWVFPWRDGIWQMNKTRGNFQKLWDGFSMVNGKLKKLLIADAAEDSAGNIWMADLDEGIILYTRSTGCFSKPFADQTGDRASAIRIFYRNGYCFSIIDRALLKWKPGEKTFNRLPLPPEMNKDVADLVPDNNGNWWMATRNGLVVFDEETVSFQRFTMADGLASNDMNGTLFCRENGTMLFGNAAYITSFDPAALLQTVHKQPMAVLRDIQVNGKQVLYDSTKPLQLDYLSTDVLLHWAITDYSNPFNNRYYCRLEGIDSGWRYAGNKGEVQYARLSPGSYKLLLRGAAANGVFSMNTLPVIFVIKAPFWQTAWFRLLLLLAIAGFFYTFFRVRVRVIRQQEKVKSAFSKQRAELEMKALRAQMNPHFVFNSLSSIQESIVTGKTDAASKYLSKFSKLIRLILENSGKKYISLSAEIETLTLYLELESFRFDNFTYIISIDPLLDANTIQIPSMLVQPFVENALKHGFAHQAGDKKLAVNIYPENGHLVAVVKDNGIGRKAAAVLKQGRHTVHQSLGIKITEDRLQLLHLQENEKASILVSDLEDEKGHATGTLVKIVLPTED